MSQAQYRVVVIGPDDEFLGDIPLDGRDLRDRRETFLADEVAGVMGSRHADACAALELIEED